MIHMDKTSVKVKSNAEGYVCEEPISEEEWNKPKHDLFDDEHWEKRRRLKKYQGKKIT